MENFTAIEHRLRTNLLQYFATPKRVDKFISALSPSCVLAGSFLLDALYKFESDSPSDLDVFFDTNTPPRLLLELIKEAGYHEDFVGKSGLSQIDVDLEGAHSLNKCKKYYKTETGRKIDLVRCSSVAECIAQFDMSILMMYYDGTTLWVQPNMFGRPNLAVEDFSPFLNYHKDSYRGWEFLHQRFQTRLQKYLCRGYSTNVVEQVQGIVDFTEYTLFVPQEQTETKLLTKALSFLSIETL